LKQLPAGGGSGDIAQLTRDLLRFIECRRDSAARCSNIEFLQQLFGLIFVDVHRVTTIEHMMSF
jgi:hypothetical protein